MITAAPTIDEVKPSQNTRRPPYAAVAYSTAKIAKSAKPGPRPKLICTTAAIHATPSAIPGENRRRARAPAISTHTSTADRAFVASIRPMPSSAGVTTSTKSTATPTSTTR